MTIEKANEIKILAEVIEKNERLCKEFNRIRKGKYSSVCLELRSWDTISTFDVSEFLTDIIDCCVHRCAETVAAASIELSNIDKEDER